MSMTSCVNRHSTSITSVIPNYDCKKAQSGKLQNEKTVHATVNVWNKVNVDSHW